MVRFVPITKTLPSGEKIKCVVCRNGGLLYHRTSPERFVKMVEEHPTLEPHACLAKVLSFSRARTQPMGGEVNLLFHESDIGKIADIEEMCYPLDKWSQTRYFEALTHLRKQREGEKRLLLEPATVDAEMAVTHQEFKKECEVMVKGCIPLKKAVRVEYQMGGTPQIHFRRYLELEHFSLNRILKEIKMVRTAANEAHIPFNVRSLYNVVTWYGAVGKLDPKYPDYEARIWGLLDSNGLRRLGAEFMPEPKGFFHTEKSIPEKWLRFRPMIRVKENR